MYTPFEFQNFSNDDHDSDDDDDNDNTNSGHRKSAAATSAPKIFSI
jgi:hypothetical protein